MGSKNCLKYEQAAVLGSALWQLWGQRKTTPCAGHGHEAALTLPAPDWDSLVSTQRDTEEGEVECSFKRRGFFSSVLMENTAQVNELYQKPAQGDRSLRCEIQDRKSINRLFKVNGILLCVTLNGALNLYAV